MSNRYTNEELASLLLDENGLPPTDNALAVIKAAIDATSEEDGAHTENDRPGHGPSVEDYRRAVIEYLNDWETETP